MHVLVVEDDRSLGAFLKKGLEMEGHRVEWAEDGEAALAQSAQGRPDLIVLDLGLPKRDGLEVLGELRARHDDAAVLVLTGRGDLQARVESLDMGADDCLLKPFSFIELTARCRALLRRRQQFADPVLRCDDLELHRVEHKVMRAGRTISLTAKEFALLECLLLHRGECVTRSQLLQEVWQMRAESGTNIVDVYINYLRHKVDVEGMRDVRRKLIQTVRGMGYRVSAAGPIQAALAPGAPRHPSISGQTYA